MPISKNGNEADRQALVKVMKNLSAMLPLEISADDRRKFELRILTALSNMYNRGYEAAAREIGLEYVSR